MSYGSSFLERWINYYASELGADNVFIVSHGEKPQDVPNLSLANLISIPRSISVDLEVKRARFTSSFVNSLLHVYEVVIFVDQDEFVCLDPSLGVSLKEYLLDKEDGVFAPFGFTPYPSSSDMSDDLPLLEQSDFIEFTPSFSKPCVRKNVVSQHTVGAHGIMNAPVTFDSNMFLFHMKFMAPTRMDELNKLSTELKNAGIGDEANIAHWVQGNDWVESQIRKRSDITDVQGTSLNNIPSSAYKIFQQENGQGLSIMRPGEEIVRLKIPENISKMF